MITLLVVVVLVLVLESEAAPAIITGVGPGLGAALARRFAREGFRVGLVARKPEFIESLAEEISIAGSSVLGVVADVSRPAEALVAVSQVRAKLGPVGVLIHNASTLLGEGLSATTPEGFEQTWRVAALGGFVCARETAPDMLATGAGAMLFTGATSSVRGGSWLAFSSAKFAVRGLAQSLARELWPRGVHVAHVVIDGLMERQARLETRANLFLTPTASPRRIGNLLRRIDPRGHSNSTSGPMSSSFSFEGHPRSSVQRLGRCHPFITNGAVDFARRSS